MPFFLKIFSRLTEVFHILEYCSSTPMHQGGISHCWSDQAHLVTKINVLIWPGNSRLDISPANARTQIAIEYAQFSHAE